MEERHRHGNGGVICGVGKQRTTRRESTGWTSTEPLGCVDRYVGRRASVSCGKTISNLVKHRGELGQLNLFFFQTLIACISRSSTGSVQRFLPELRTLSFFCFLGVIGAPLRRHGPVGL